MSLAAFAPDVFGASILEPFRDASVFAGRDVVTRDWVWENQRPIVDQAKAFSFQVDDADTAGRTLTLVAEEVARALAAGVDEFMASNYTHAANLAPSTGTANVFDECLMPLSAALDEAGASLNGRYVIVPPAVYFRLRLDSRFIQTSGANGLVGTAARFGVRMSNHCANPAASTFVIQAGTADAITFGECIGDVEVERSDTSPDTVRGVARYGCRVVQPSHLACCLVTLH